MERLAALRLRSARALAAMRSFSSIDGAAALPAKNNSHQSRAQRSRRLNKNIYR